MGLGLDSRRGDEGSTELPTQQAVLGVTSRQDACMSAYTVAGGRHACMRANEVGSCAYGISHDATGANLRTGAHQLLCLWI